MAKKVLIITATLAHGGVERLTADTAKVLAKGGNYTPLVAVLFGKGELIEELVRAGVDYKLLSFENVWNISKNIRVLRSLIIKFKPLLIHTNQFASDFYGCLASRGLGIKIVSHLHNPSADPFSRKIVRTVLAITSIDAFIASVEDAAKNIRRYWPPSAKKTYMLYNAINPESLKLQLGFNPFALRESLGIENNNVIVGSVGRLAWEKGYDVLIRSFAEAHKKYPNSSLLLVGEGRDEKKLKELANNLGIEKNVIFTGWKSNVAPYLSIFDMFVVSSYTESFSIAAVEAMYFGVPLITTKRLSTKDLFSSGSLVVRHSVSGFRDGIASLIENPAKRRELGGSAKKLVEEKLLLDSYSKKLEEIYTDVLNKK